jgi:hypothetical protein
MSDFNPDEYLAKTESEFDPDKYLSSTPTTVEQPIAPGDITAVQGLMSAAKPYAQAAYDLTGGMRDAANIAKNLVTQVGPAGRKEILTNPVQAAKAYFGGHPAFGQGLSGMTASGVQKILSPIAAPENLFTLPYSLAAYEQEQIRQNPNAPGLESNPFAQVQRGEASTQGSAGAANQMKAVANMPYGNVTPQERAILEEDARMKSAIRKKAFEKVMGPVVPGSF